MTLNWLGHGLVVALLGGLQVFLARQTVTRQETNNRYTLTSSLFQSVYRDLFELKEVLVALQAQLAVWLFISLLS